MNYPSLRGEVSARMQNVQEYIKTNSGIKLSGNMAIPPLLENRGILA